MSKKTKAEERAAKAAAALAERKRRERRRNILTGASVLLVIALIAGVIFWVVSSRDAEEDEAASQASDYGVTIGDSDAPHSIIIYEDFLCPVCGALEAETRDDLAELAAEGKVQVDYRPFNLFSTDGDPRKPYSVDAANAFAVVLQESGAEVAKEFHDILFEEQPSEAGPFPEADQFVEWAVDAGAEEGDVRPGIEEGAEQDWVAEATREAAAAGVSSTPTILLDGEEFLDGRTMEEVGENLVAAVR
jgi:protein-disulfide isomerase